MNYLAHALLSTDHPHEIMGNLWGDLLRPRDYDQLASGVLNGVERHKEIDRFTDQHAAVDRMNELFRPHQGKYTPVVVDVIMDYILSQYWHSYAAESLNDFCEKKYHIVSTHLHLIPSRLHPRIIRMQEHRWLESCRDRHRLQSALQMLSGRASFENNIAAALEPYEMHKDEMDGLFQVFFADLQTHLMVSLRSES